MICLIVGFVVVVLVGALCYRVGYLDGEAKQMEKSAAVLTRRAKDLSP